SSSARQLVFDAYMVAASPAAPSAPTTVVSIDEDSLTRHGSWPWPSSRLAEPIDRARDRGATAIGFALTDRGGTDQPSARLADLATLGDPVPQFKMPLPGSLLPSAASLQGAAGAGALNVFPDNDGRVRPVPLPVQLKDVLYPSLVAELLLLRLGERSYLARAVPGDADAAMRLKIGSDIDRFEWQQ
ncbi:MAG: CHASE2 domain-containing protein, partial [Thiohalocapsa sp.]